MKLIKEAYLSGERALFKSVELTVENCVFADGESPLKESKDIKIKQSIFRWKYPLWYCNNVEVDNTTLLQTARSGIWYTNNIAINNSIIEAPKTFRRCNNVSLSDVNMPEALESFWNCKDIEISKVSVHGDYFAKDSQDINIDKLELTGNYCFDGVKNIIVRNSKLISKDAFWNCENVTVYDSIIVGEYLAWNSKNVTFVNCVIESLQGLCYVENLVMKNCKLINTNLAFEYSSVDVDIVSHIDSIKNPICGTIKAKSIKEIIMDDTNTNDVEIILETNDKEVEVHNCIC